MFGYRENKRNWRKVENYIKRRNLESSQIRNVSKVFKWVYQVSIYRPRSSGHLASSKRSSGGFFIKESGEKAFSHEPLAISHDDAKWKIHQLHFRSSGTFRMTVRKFRMVMRNHFFTISLCAATNILSISFRMVMRNWKTCFFDSFLQFLPFLHF